MEYLFLLIVFLVVCLLLTVFALLVYSGLFHSVEIRAGKPPFSEITVCYKFSRGPYKNAGALFTEVYNLAPKLKSIGLYYDDPSEVSASDLRYVVGAIISEGDQADSKFVEERELLTRNGFRTTRFPAVTHALMTTFPFRNTLSIFLALGRVYPRLGAYIKERNLCAHPMIEVYEDDIIHFVAPLSKQDEFYVPEALEAEEEDRHSDTRTSRKGSVQEIAALNKPGGEPPSVTPKEGSTNGSGEESTGSSFEELNVDNDK